MIFADFPEAIYLATNLRTIVVFDGKVGTSLFCHSNIWNNVFWSQDDIEAATRGTVMQLMHYNLKQSIIEL